MPTPVGWEPGRARSSGRRGSAPPRLGCPDPTFTDRPFGGAVDRGRGGSPVISCPGDPECRSSEEGAGEPPKSQARKRGSAAVIQHEWLRKRRSWWEALPHAQGEQSGEKSRACGEFRPPRVGRGIPTNGAPEGPDNGTGVPSRRDAPDGLAGGRQAGTETPPRRCLT